MLSVDEVVTRSWVGRMSTMGCLHSNRALRDYTLRRASRPEISDHSQLCYLSLSFFLLSGVHLV